jgi:hypothetical protein
MAKLVGTTPNALSRNGRTSDVEDQADVVNLLQEKEATTKECDSLAAKSSQVPSLETSTSSLVDELAKIPVPLQVVENSDGTVTTSFTITKEELKTNLKNMPSILARPMPMPMPTVVEDTPLEESSLLLLLIGDPQSTSQTCQYGNWTSWLSEIARNPPAAVESQSTELSSRS